MYHTHLNGFQQLTDNNPLCFGLLCDTLKSNLLPDLLNRRAIFSPQPHSPGRLLLSLSGLKPGPDGRRAGKTQVKRSADNRDIVDIKSQKLYNYGVYTHVHFMCEHRKASKSQQWWSGGERHYCPAGRLSQTCWGERKLASFQWMDLETEL